MDVFAALLSTDYASRVALRQRKRKRGRRYQLVSVGGSRGLHEWTRRRRRERPELGAGARAGGCPGPAPLHGGGPRALRGRAGGQAGLGGAGPGGRRPEARRAGAGHDAPKEAEPPAAREMRGGQRSGVRGREGGGAGVGSEEWVQVGVEGDS